MTNDADKRLQEMIQSQDRLNAVTASKIITIAEAILEREKYGQLCPDTVKQLEKIKEAD